MEKGNLSSEYRSLLDFDRKLGELLHEDRYLSRNDYRNLAAEYAGLCGFMTNDLRGGILPILKCDKCKNGYLIVKPGREDMFLGCTNYRSDGKGCDGTMSKSHYLKYVADKSPEVHVE